MLLCVTAAEDRLPAAPFMLQDGSFFEHIATASAAGFQGLELQIADPARLDADALLRQCEIYDMRVTSLATGLACREGLSLSASDSWRRTIAIDRLRSHVDLARRLGGRPSVLIGLLIGKRVDSSGPKAYFSSLADSVRRVADYAARHGIPVCLEPVNHRDSDALNTWEETVDFLDRAGCAAVRLALDLYHMRMEEADLVATIRRYPERIGLVQMMDENRLAPGLGCFNFAPLVQAVLDAGYDGPVTMECLPRPDAQTAMKMAAAFYHKYFTKMQ